MAHCPNPQEAEIVYHDSVKKKPDVKLQWAKACKRNDVDLTKCDRFLICSNHFSSAQYERDMRNELLGLPIRKILKKDAVPDRNLPKSEFARIAATVMEPQNGFNAKKLPSHKPIVFKEKKVNSILNASRSCAVRTCINPWGISYHNFPSDKRADSWMKACGITKIPKSAKVCERHFSDDCYEEDLEHKALGLPARKKLKKDAIPNIRLTAVDKLEHFKEIENMGPMQQSIEVEIPEVESISEVNEPSELSTREKRRRARVRKLLAKSVMEKKAEDERKAMQKEIDDLKKANKQLEQKVETCVQEVKAVNSKNRILELSNEKYRKKTEKLKKEVKRLKIVKPKEVRSQMNKLFEKRGMTRGNRKMLLNPDQKWVHYSDEEKVLALVTSSISRKCYLQMRASKQIILPHESTLYRWLAKFDLYPGFQEDAIRVISTIRKETKLENYELSGIAFDEVDIKKNRYELEKKSQTVYGPVGKMQCVMIRGLRHG